MKFTIQLTIDAPKCTTTTMPAPAAWAEQIMADIVNDSAHKCMSMYLECRKKARGITDKTLKSNYMAESKLWMRRWKQRLKVRDSIRAVGKNSKET
jgi:hypothetical protein